MEPVIQFFQNFPLDLLLIQTVNGIVTGLILALVASGLTLIFGIMDVVNFAHGELFMLGAYLGVVVMASTGNFWLALIVATLIVAVLGAALQIVTLRPLIGRDPLNTILVTFGISLILQNFALWEFGPVSRKLPEPITSHFNLFYLQYPWYRIVIAALSAAIIGGFWLFLKYGKFGIWIRATTQDRVMAQAMGIPVPWVYTGVFAIGAAMAAASGVLFGPLGSINHTMGLDWVLKAFIVVVVGGMGNLGGSIAAAIFISLLEAYAAIWVDPSQAVIVSFVVLILTLLFRPTGLFVRHQNDNRAARQDDAAQQARIEPHGRLLDRFLRGHGAADRGAAGVAGILGEVPDRDPDLGPAGDVVRSADRLHRHDLVRPFGLLRPRHVRRGRRAVARRARPICGSRSSSGLVGAAGVALFVAYFSTRLRDIYFAITTLIFSPDLLRHHLHLDGGHRRRERADLHPPAFLHPVSRTTCASPPRRCTGSCWRWSRAPI